MRWIGGLYVVPHSACSHQQSSGIITPLRMINRRTVQSIRLRIIIDIVIRIYQPDIPQPIPSLLRPLRIQVIVRIPCQSAREVEETSVGNRVLQIVTSDLVDLPPDAPIAELRVPASHLLVKDGLCEGKPGRLRL